MPQFLVTARDGTDADAPNRRLAARPAHMERIRPFVESGALLIGGAMLDAAGRMTGSTFVADFPDRSALETWIAEDPYTAGDVWRTVEITPFRVAVASGFRA